MIASRIVLFKILNLNFEFKSTKKDVELLFRPAMGSNGFMGK